MSSFLEHLQLAAAGHLARQPEFAHVPVTAIRPRSADEAMQINDLIDGALIGMEKKNGKSGAAAIVQMPALGAANPDTPGPLVTVTLVVRVIEFPLVNMNAETGTCLSAETLALAALESLHHYFPFDAGGVTLADGAAVPLPAPLPAGLKPYDRLNLYAEGSCLEPVEGFEGKIVYDVTVHTKTGLIGRNY
jgi:hypothetical protein